MFRIFIVEDELTIRTELKTLLEKYGYECITTDDFTSVLSAIEAASPHLILLDINLPHFDGYHICREIRSHSQIPIIIVTSRNSDVDELMRMNLGADDFITKPFDFHVLTAKIQALLRRTYSFSKSMQILTYKDLVLNILDATISYHHQTIELTKNELKILQVLFEKSEVFVSRDDLMMALWQSNEFIDDNTLSVNMNRLRKKLDDFHIEHLIQTKKGLGYKLAYE